MQNFLWGGLGGLPLITGGKSRAINAENPRGEKGRGGMAASHLGPSRKGSPCIGEIKPGETALLGEIEGPGVIQHIWITVTDKTSDADRFVLRDLVLRMYWDGEEIPLGGSAPGGLLLLRLRPGVPGQFPAHRGQPQPGL